jgi:hypothetical protein
VRKLQQLVFALLLIFLPSQLGLHFWPDWAFINGVRVDYFSPTLYLTDILVGLLFLLSVRRLPRQSLRSFLAMTGIAIFVLLNIYFSYSPFVTIYKWLKVIEFGFLVWWMAKHKPRLKLLIVPIIYSFLLALWQFIKQGSVGGLWYWLGERTFTVNTPGIAAAVINGQLILRPYATFPHPNVLAGFLVVGGFLIITYIPRNYRIITVAVISLVFFLTLSRGNLINGWQLRQQLNNVAIEQWVKSPIFGTGLGTSPLYPRNIANFALLHQPIHNIYLLLLSETGVAGLVGFLVVIKKRFSWFLLPILFLGLFDHYFLTLQQGQLLLALVLGIIG